MTSWVYNHITSLLVFFPLGTALLSLLAKKEKTSIAFNLVGSLVTFAINMIIWFNFKTHCAQLQFYESYQWIEYLGIKYIVGIDGINILLITLTSFLTPLVLLSIIGGNNTQKKYLCFLICALECGMLGALVAFDLVFFYVFWEVMLIPMYFIIGVWGGKNRIYATTKFIIYTAFGSLFMIVAAIMLYLMHYQQFGFYSTNLLDLYQIKIVNETYQGLLFAAFALAFAIKVPLWPFHTWLPHAHTEAPTSGSVILAGIMLKMGTYGLLRFAIPLFPEATIKYAPIILILGVIGIIFGAFMAWMQNDAKKMIAYSSVSHLGYVVIGSFAIFSNSLNQEALLGASYQMINHGISTGALFFLVGMIYERRHTRMLDEYGGLAKSMPWFAVMLIIATMGSIGLPGTGGFVGEFLILLGVFQTNQIISIIACLGVLLGAIYMLTLCKKILFGPLANDKNKNLKDLSTIELSYILPLIVLIIVMGICPNIFLNKIKPSVSHLAANFQKYNLEKEKTNPY
jgi:NADH-quinone oxidoreductase subunit M